MSSGSHARFRQLSFPPPSRGLASPGSSIVTRAALEKVYQQLLLEDSASQTGAHLDPLMEGETVEPERYFHAVDAFKMPRTVFDERRKVFER